MFENGLSEQTNILKEIEILMASFIPGKGILENWSDTLTLEINLAESVGLI